MTPRIASRWPAGTSGHRDRPVSRARGTVLTPGVTWDGIPIPVGTRVEQITVTKGYGALKARLGKRGEVTGRGHYLSRARNSRPPFGAGRPGRSAAANGPELRAAKRLLFVKHREVVSGQLSCTLRGDSKRLSFKYFPSFDCRTCGLDFVIIQASPFPGSHERG